MTTKIGRMLTYLEGLLAIKSYNAYMSTARVLMATKLGRMVAYNDGLLSI